MEAVPVVDSEMPFRFGRGVDDVEPVAASGQGGSGLGTEDLVGGVIGLRHTGSGGCTNPLSGQGFVVAEHRAPCEAGDAFEGMQTFDSGGDEQTVTERVRHLEALWPQGSDVNRQVDGQAS